MEQLAQHIRNIEEALTFFRTLRSDSATLWAMAQSDTWPEAVESEGIADGSVEQRRERAQSVVEIMFSDDLNGKRVLDYGCGDGFVMMVLAVDHKIEYGVGFDSVVPNMTDVPGYPPTNMLLTDDINLVHENGPYDYVLLYDVLDHLTGIDPVDVLKTVKTVLKPEGNILVRVHPWCSRHGPHFFRQLNKAFIHLVFTDDELESKGVKGENINKIIHPLTTYRGWFASASLTVVQETPTNDFVEDYFRQPILAERIQMAWKESVDDNLRAGTTFPDFQMGMSFIDYVLR